MSTPVVLFEDKYLLVLNKPSGLVAESDEAGHESLQGQALQYIRAKEKYPDKCFIGLPHRLDRPVSGLVLLAKKKSVLKMLSEIFATRQITKTYVAITETCPTEKEGILVNWLVKDKVQRKAIIRTKQVKDAARAELHYRVLAQQNNRALLEIKLLTGKYHQIRAQLAHIGCAVLGDTLYGSKVLYQENAICLHAHKLQLIHPLTAEPLDLTAPLPDDDKWNDFKNSLR